MGLGKMVFDMRSSSHEAVGDLRDAGGGLGSVVSRWSGVKVLLVGTRGSAAALRAAGVSEGRGRRQTSERGETEQEVT